MKAISYFDKPITQIMPAERKYHPYALSNMFVMTDLKTMYQGVETHSWRPLFEHYDDKLKRN